MADTTSARQLIENQGICFQGPVIVGPFDLAYSVAQTMLNHPNPHGKSNEDVIFPLVNGAELVGRSKNRYIVDFANRTVEQSALYERPFEYVRKNVKPLRDKNRRKKRRDNWWLHGESGIGLRAAVAGLNRKIVTAQTAKHRIYRFMPVDAVASVTIIVFAREDDYFFGLLHSKAHEIWALNMGTQLESRPRYTPTTTFETFPFPSPTDSQKGAISDAARRLNELRENWLEPPKDSIPSSELKKRTLTNLYNARPTWLDNAHSDLDRAVFAAYVWEEDPADLPEQEVLARLLKLNFERQSV